MNGVYNILQRYLPGVSSKLQCKFNSYSKSIQHRGMFLDGNAMLLHSNLNLDKIV